MHTLPRAPFRLPGPRSFANCALAACIGLAALAPPAGAVGVSYVQSAAGDWTAVDASGRSFSVVPDVVTARFRPEVSDAEQGGLLAELELEVLRANRLGFVDLKLRPGTDPIATANALAASGLVASAEPNTIGAYVAVPNDPQFGNQWHWNEPGDADVDAPEAWDLEVGAPTAIVAVLDSGTEFTHEDLGLGTDGYQNVWLNPGEDVWSNPNDPTTGNGVDDDGNGFVDDWKGWDFPNDNNNPSSFFDHGTSVAGVVTAKTNNGTDAAGIAGGWGAPGVRVMIGEVGEFFPEGSILDDAILYATDEGADIITMSLTVAQTAAIDAALEAAWQAGVFIDCAAGNGSGPPVGYPANDPHVVAVGATDLSGAKASFSSWGDEQGLGAPGAEILTLTIGNGTTTTAGTSFSAPLVAGVAGLVKSVNPSLTNTEVRQILRDTAEKVGPYNYNWDPSRPGHSRELGYGRVNAHQAVVAAMMTTAVTLAAPTSPTPGLSQNTPNPFNPSTTIRFQTPVAGAVSLKVYAPSGRWVTTLVEGALGAGEHAVSWSGVDHQGRPVPSGVYLYELDAGGQRLARKLHLSK